MSKLADMKRQFLSDVSDANIQYSWDGGWCYSYISHPIMEEAENVLSDEQKAGKDGIEWSELDEFLHFTDTWLSEHEEMLYHMSDVVDGRLVNQAGTLEGEAAKEYARGLIALIEKFYPNYTFYTEKLHELKAFINS